MKSYDLIVIGAGSGLDVAVEAAERGLKTAIIEEGPLGGTCLNRGCIPSKMVIHSADVVQEIKNSSLFGISSQIKTIDFKKITARATQIVDDDSHEIEQSLRRGKNPTLYKSRGTFIGKYTLQVGKETITGKKIIIAAGARSFTPPIEGLDTVPYLTSTEALRQTKLPLSMIIVGGGYIAAELGYFYASMGCSITIIQRNKLLIPNADKDVAELFTKLWTKKYKVVLNAEVKKVEKKGKNITVSASINGKIMNVSAEKILIATGRKSNSDLLDLGKTGVTVNERGFIVVNAFLETSVPNIWALGDIAGVYQFKHSANLEAESVLQNLFSTKKAVDYYPMPWAIFTNPQVAGVEMSEQEAVDKKINYVVGRYDYKNTGMGAALQETDGFVKFIVDKKTKEILGCHIIGPEASTLIHEVVVAMKADRKRALSILQQAVHVHPALSEVVQRAARSVSL